MLYIYGGYVTASEYYVSSTNNGNTCPTTDLPCHNLSFYAADYKFYFTDDAIFYFLNGTHTLQQPLTIIHVSNLTLQGQGNIEQGFHKTVLQSTSIIMCNSYIGGINFFRSANVVIKSITIANCGYYNYISYRQTNVSLLFVNVIDITLECVSIQNGSGYGLFLMNTFDVLIVNSSFVNNQPTQTCPYCAGGNACLVYLNQFTTKALYKVNIVHSNFTFGLNPETCTTNENNEVSYKPGGGLSIVLHLGEQSKIQFYIDSVVFYHNIGNVGANFHFSVFSGHYSLIVNNTIIIYGETLTFNCSFGGGMSFVDFADNDSEIVIENSNFSHNVAQQFGGGVAMAWFHGSGNIKFENCIIYNNTGYLGSGLVLYVSNAFEIIPTPTFQFTIVSFDSNKEFQRQDKFQAAIALVNIRNITFEQIEVKNHKTTGLIGSNCLFTFDKDSKFINNSGILGGGIALYDSSKIILKEFTNISFINNHAAESGGGIFVSQVAAVNIPTDCFFKVISNNTRATFYFVNNTADISGDILYGGNIFCLFNKGHFDQLFKYPQQTGLSVVSSDPIQVCFCVSERQYCFINSININAMPGINVKISLATVGLKDGLTKGVIKLTSSDGSYSVQTNDNRLNATCTNVTFNLRPTRQSLNATKIFVILESSVSELTVDSLAKIINVTMEPCPIGFPLINNTCVCRSELNTSSITCDINTQIISRDGETWIGYRNDSDCLIVYPNCPFDYCNDNTVHFRITSPDPQCLFHRSGLLCGQCAEGLSLMLGSNQCGECTNDYLVLIIPFALAGVALVAFLIALNLTVSVGTINGLIFYTNVVKIYEPIFFPNGPVPFLSQFISWLNLDLGIDTCFYHGMNSCSKVWLQFIFPGYVWFLLIVIIILTRYSSKVVRLVGRQIIPVLATMILLSYTKLIRNVFQVLHYNNIQCNGKNTITLLMWYIDANVHYLKSGGCHLPLFLFSLVVLILLIVPYTFYLLTIPLFEGPLSKYMCCCQRLSMYMKPFFDAYGGPYKDKCRFWTGFLLLVRVILALVVSLAIDTTISLDFLISFLIIITSMYFLLRGIYRQFPLACLELSFILNLMFMSYANVLTCKQSKSRRVLSVVLVSVAFVVFCGIILFHVWDHVLKTHLQRLLAKVKDTFKKPPLPSTLENMELPSIYPGSPAVICETTSVSVVMRRESLLDDTNDIPHHK